MADIDDTIPASVAIENRIVPLREIGQKLVVATAEQVSTETRERIAFILNRELRFVIRSHGWIEAELETRYRQPDDCGFQDDGSDSISWYWPDWNYLEGNVLVVKASGWMGGTHWTGIHEFPADHPDREFWNWLIRIPQYHGLLDEREIPRIKRVWKRYRQRVPNQ